MNQILTMFCNKIYIFGKEARHCMTFTGSHKTLGTILRDPIVPSSVGQVGLSGYSAIFSSQSAR